MMEQCCCQGQNAKTKDEVKVRTLKAEAKAWTLETETKASSLESTRPISRPHMTHYLMPIYHTPFT